MPSVCALNFFSVVSSCCVDVDNLWTSRTATNRTVRRTTMIQKWKKRYGQPFKGSVGSYSPWYDVANCFTNFNEVKWPDFSSYSRLGTTILSYPLPLGCFSRIMEQSEARNLEKKGKFLYLQSKFYYCIIWDVSWDLGWEFWIQVRIIKCNRLIFTSSALDDISNTII